MAAQQHKIGIVGSGLIGKSWTLVFSRAGYQVCMFDIIPGASTNALKDVEDKLKQLENEGLIRGRTAKEAFSLVSATESLEHLAQFSTYIQECVPETLQAKAELFGKLDALVGDKTLLCSSTSNIKASLFTENLKHRANCIVAHPINPPHLIPAVELVPAPWTSPETVAEVRRLLQAVGQAPLQLLKEIDGFVVNRLQYGLLGEAFRLVQDQVIGAADLDLAISAGLGLRWSFMGPFQTIDLNAPQGVEDYCNRFANAIMAVMKQEDNTRNCFTPDVVEHITKEMRAQVPLERLKQREAWRNARLARLAVHKHDQEAAGDRVSATASGAYLNRLMGLHGQVVVLTGGTGVLGREMAIGLTAVGARVVLLGRNEQKAKEAVAAVKEKVPAADVSYELADVLQRSQLESASTRILASHGGRIDVLVNAAGGNLPQATLPVEKSIFELSEQAFREVTDLNLLGTVLPTLVFGAVFAKQGTGNIVNISSMAAARTTTRVVGYSAAKAAMENFTRSCAVDLARRYGTNIRVNAIAPGFFVTEQNKAVLTNPDGTPTARGQTIIAHTPAGRFGKAEELVSALLYLTAPASRFVTGTTVIVDGGFSAFSGV